MKPKSTKTLPLHEMGCIRIRGARTNNLKAIDVDIPYNQLVAITGLSGSGKSSFGFGTLFAEGSRRYMESFSTHARQFLEKTNRRVADSIQGVLPSIGLSRKESSSNPRTRVGTTTDIYTYMKLLFARFGVTHSPISGEEVKRHTVEDVLKYVASCEEGEPIIIAAPLHRSKDRSWEEVLKITLGKGFVRLICQGKIILIDDLLQSDSPVPDHDIYVVIDRFKVAPDQDGYMGRVAESVRTAFFEGQGVCVVDRTNGTRQLFSDRFEADGMTFETPSVHFFSFNSSYGSCQQCQGLGECWALDPEKIIPNESLSLREGAIVPWKSALYIKWQEEIIEKANLPAYRAYKALTPKEKVLLWEGNKEVKGIHAFFEWLASQKEKVQHRILYARYRSITTCHLCQGSGLRKDIAYVKIGGKSLLDLLKTPIDALYDFFVNLSMPAHQQKASNILVDEIQNRLSYLMKVGLSYLTLNRQTRTLSGGEYQRARLAKILGSPLVESLYVLDEPTSGLHQRDADQLLQTLLDLKNADNTVVVVGHEELIMRAACNIIDIGPKGGPKGGELVFQGDWDALIKTKKSYTADYLTGKRHIPVPASRRSAKHVIRMEQVRTNNLKNIDANFPLGVFTVVSGVSGGGKSTLVNEALYPALCNHLGKMVASQRRIPTLLGDIDIVQQVIYIGQNTLVKSTRSTLATYLEAYECIRNLFAQQPLAKERGYTMSFFSYNVPGGRCKECSGEGEVKIDMQFMEDIYLTCEACNGKRFQDEVLEVRFLGKNITEVLEMTVEESLEFFADHPQIINKLAPLAKLGLEFLRLGQSTKSFSSGESQRVKLAFYMNTEHVQGHTFFIFDEPTVGLHFHDIKRLLASLHALVDQGHTVLVIEHNMDVIKSADWIIDLGPEGGEAGGRIIFSGKPEEMIKLSDNHTARYLSSKLTSSRP